MGSEAFHKGKYYVTFKRGFEDCKKDVTITVYKVFENDSLRIVLSDDEDPTFLCVLIVTRCDYEDLKKQQGLLIDFDNFPAQLVRLLQQCSTNNMFLIMHQANPAQFFFEVIEHNEFKRLVHLSLKTAPANDADIKKHMADTIANLKNSLLSIKGSLSSSEALWSDKCMSMEIKIHELTLAVSRIEEERRRVEAECQESLRHEKEKLAQERIQLQRTSELNTKSQVANVQENLNRKDKQIEELTAVIKQQKENSTQLENRLSDKTHRLNMLENEVQKAHIEVATVKAKNTTLERELLDKEKHVHQMQLKCMDLEKTVKDNSEVIKELNGSLKILRKEKLCLEERLAISESLSNRKNEAANSTTEQLMKANQIISKQNSDLIELKEKMLTRTAIALEQEKVIEGNAKEIENLKTELKETRRNNDMLRQELENLTVKHASSEKALQDKEEMIKNNNLVIQWLHKKMEDNQLSAPPSRSSAPRQDPLAASSSTPYFLSNRNNSDNLNAQSDESINFYATSKLSEIGESPRPEVQHRSDKTGLDPKYLKPADEKKPKSASGKGAALKTTAEVVNQQGKENKNTNLPKVDYREKKSSRPVSYRSTPVSAYFP